MRTTIKDVANVALELQEKCHCMWASLSLEPGSRPHYKVFIMLRHLDCSVILYCCLRKWKKTLAYLLVLPGSRARIVRCGGRYDPQLVKRSSE